MARGDVEEAELVGAGRVIGDGRFHRIAGVAQIDEIDALDHAAVFDVEAGNDADLEHGQAAALRVADELERFRRVEPPVIERAAGDGAFSFFARGSSSALMSSIEARPPEAITGIEIASASAMVASRLRPLQHAVARDVGVDDGGDAGVLEAARDVERRQFRRLRPALHRHLAVARVEPDRDLARENRAPPP